MSVVVVSRPLTKWLKSLTEANEIAEKGKGGRTYKFNVNGEKFEAFVDEDGWVMIATSPPGAKPKQTLKIDREILAEGDGKILPAEVLAAFDRPDLFRVRIQDEIGGDGTIHLESSNAAVLDRLQAYSALTENTGDEALWANTGTLGITVAKVPGTAGDALNDVIYHAMGSATELHWAPAYQLNGNANKTVKEQLNMWLHSPFPLPPTQLESRAYQNPSSLFIYDPKERIKGLLSQTVPDEFKGTASFTGEAGMEMCIRFGLNKPNFIGTGTYSYGVLIYEESGQIMARLGSFISVGSTGFFGQPSIAKEIPSDGEGTVPMVIGSVGDEISVLFDKLDHLNYTLTSITGETVSWNRDADLEMNPGGNNITQYQDENQMVIEDHSAANAGIFMNSIGLFEQFSDTTGTLSPTEQDRNSTGNVNVSVTPNNKIVSLLNAEGTVTDELTGDISLTTGEQEKIILVYIEKASIQAPKTYTIPPYSTAAFGANLTYGGQLHPTVFEATLQKVTLAGFVANTAKDPAVFTAPFDVEFRVGGVTKTATVTAENQPVEFDFSGDNVLLDPRVEVGFALRAIGGEARIINGNAQFGNATASSGNTTSIMSGGPAYSIDVIE